MRTALVHDWLTGMRGGERCLEALCELYPDADLFTLLHVPGRVSATIERRRIVTSFVQRLPGAATRYRQYLPLFPAAVARFDLSAYDLVISVSHCAAKAVRPRRDALHVCYCLTPMRYVWDRYDDYAGPGSPVLPRVVMPVLTPALRRWDRAATARVDRFVAISRFVAERIDRYYGREADVVHPPVDVGRFPLADADPDDAYLVVSALVPYKRVDLAVQAAKRMGRRLLVVGTGPEERRLRALAGPSVAFLGWLPDREVARHYRRCRAVLFPGVEDFGIVPLEAMASGRPVIAFREGGASETITGLGEDDTPTGVFFETQTVDALVRAIERFEAAPGRFEPQALRARAEAYDRPRFLAAMAGRLAAWTAEGR